MTKVALSLHTWVAACIRELKHVYAGMFLYMQLGFQKENLMKLCRVRFFFKRSLILGTMWNWDEN